MIKRQFYIMLLFPSLVNFFFISEGVLEINYDHLELHMRTEVIWDFYLRYINN